MNDGIGFLIGDVARAMRRRFDERARQIGVTRPQWRVLVTLERGEGVQQATLAERLEVEPITLCRMIDRLVEAGLVERRRDPADRRAWNIYLTECARPMLHGLHAVADDLFAVALDGIDPDDSTRLTAMLERIRCNLLPPTPTRETAHG